MQTQTIDVEAWIGSHRRGSFHIMLLLGTCIVMFMEGYDMQVMSYAAPAIMKAWHLTNAYFGPVFGFGLFGNLLGGTVLSHLGDRYGRKKIIVAGAIFFGLFTLAAAYATSLQILLVLRFLAGVGLGASIPAAIALAIEYAPKELEARTVSFLYLGYTLGGTLGGFLAAKLIPAFGWPSTFIVGGVAPIVLALIVAFTLPESVRFLALRPERSQEVRTILRRIYNDPALSAENIDFRVNEEKHEGLPVKHLFTEGRAGMTALLWLAFISSLFGHYFMTSWLPTILAAAAVPLTYAIISGALLQGGGGIGGLMLCWLSDKKSMLFIALSFCCAVPFLIALPHARGPLLLVLAFCVGFLIVGGQIGLNSIAGTVYPTAVRATGVGWALGIGRVGSILGPVVGGILISSHVSTQKLFFGVAGIALLCATSIFLVWKAAGKRKYTCLTPVVE